MRKKYIDTVSQFQPFTAALQEGASPDDIKSEIISILTAYVNDKKVLAELAVSHFSNEAISVGILSSNPLWKKLLDFAFNIRQTAIELNKELAFQALCFFEPHIREGQRKYSLQIIFEEPKEGLNTEEYAFETFRIIGSLIESSIQPFLKEFFCLLTLTHRKPVDPKVIFHYDLGKLAEECEQLLPDKDLTTLPPWNIRINQWRNIAQHHDYLVKGENITAYYGKKANRKEIILDRKQLFGVAKELIRRLGILKSSRELVNLNNIEELRPILPETAKDPYTAITELGASFATQGFKLSNLIIKDNKLTVWFADVAPQLNELRHIHCSQFLIPLSYRFPEYDLELHYRNDTQAIEHVFSANATDLETVKISENPLIKLADIIDVKKENAIK